MVNCVRPTPFGVVIPLSSIVITLVSYALNEYASHGMLSSIIEKGSSPKRFSNVVLLSIEQLKVIVPFHVPGVSIALTPISAFTPFPFSSFLVQKKFCLVKFISFSTLPSSRLSGVPLIVISIIRVFGISPWIEIGTFACFSPVPSSPHNTISSGTVIEYETGTSATRRTSASG